MGRSPPRTSAMNRQWLRTDPSRLGASEIGVRPYAELYSRCVASNRRFAEATAMPSSKIRLQASSSEALASAGLAEVVTGIFRPAMAS